MAQIYLPGNAPTGWGAWALAVIFVAPVVPLAWGVVEAWRRRRRGAVRFHGRARDKGLSPDQSRLLLRLVRRQGAGDPADVLRSAARFDRCVHANGRPVGPQTARELTRIRAALGFDQLLPGDHLRTTRQLGRGDRLLLRRAGEDAEPDAPWVVESQDDRALTATPLLAEADAGVSHWKAGDRVEAEFRQGRDITYGFVTDVLTVEPATRRLLLRHTLRVERVQHRSFFRLSTQFAVVLLVGDGTAPVDLEEAARLEGAVLDISGGGLRVRVPEAPPVDARLTVDQAFTGPFPLAGVGCEVVAALERDEGVYLRLRFVELAGEVETAIVRGIYERQLGVRETQSGREGGTPAGDRTRESRRGEDRRRGSRRTRQSGLVT